MRLSRPRLVIPQWQSIQWSGVSDGYGTELREYGIRNTLEGTLQNRTRCGVFPRLPRAIVQSTERAGNPTTQTTRPFDWLSNGHVPALALRQRLPETAKRTLLPLFCHFLPSCLISVHKGRPDRSQTDGAVRTRPRRRRRPRGPNQASTRPARDTRGRADSAERGRCAVVCVQNTENRIPTEDSRSIPCVVIILYSFQITSAGQLWLFPANSPSPIRENHPPTREPTREPAPPPRTHLTSHLALCTARCFTHVQPAPCSRKCRSCIIGSGESGSDDYRRWRHPRHGPPCCSSLQSCSATLA